MDFYHFDWREIKFCFNQTCAKNYEKLCPSLPQSEVTTPAPAALLFDYFTILCTEEAKTDVINDIAKTLFCIIMDI